MSVSKSASQSQHVVTIQCEATTTQEAAKKKVDEYLKNHQGLLHWDTVGHATWNSEKHCFICTFSSQVIAESLQQAVTQEINQEKEHTVPPQKSKKVPLPVSPIPHQKKQS